MLDRIWRSCVSGTGLALLLWSGSSVAADVPAGLQAFRNGDYATAYREWKPAAERGQPDAQYNLGVLYMKGLGVRSDRQEAFRWFRLAADQGLAQAQFEVGRIREQGWGVAPDYAEAQRWYLLAAQQGDSAAHHGA